MSCGSLSFSKSGSVYLSQFICVELFLVFLYYPFDVCKVLNNSSWFIPYNDVLSSFFVSRPRSLSILLTFSKNQLFILLIFSGFSVSNFNYLCLISFLLFAWIYFVLFLHSPPCLLCLGYTGNLPVSGTHQTIPTFDHYHFFNICLKCSFSRCAIPPSYTLYQLECHSSRASSLTTKYKIAIHTPVVN